MKTEKKEYNVARQEYFAVTKRNKKIATGVMIVMGLGLLLKYFQRADIGEHFMWLGFIMIVYVFGSNMMAKSELRKHAPNNPKNKQIEK